MPENPTNRAIAAAEVMADHVRRGTVHRIIDELVAKIMEWARKLFPDLQLTKAEVRAILSRADQYLETAPENTAYLGGEADAQYARENVQAWPEGLEKAEVHTTVSALKKFPQYDAAKEGDREAGLATAQRFIKPKKVLALKEQHPDAIVVFVHAEESAGRNTIPLGMAAVYEDAGFTVDAEIVQSSKAERTKKSSVLRLVSLPKFAGPVTSGGKHVLLDDVLGQGGTVNELRHHIESNGGQVVAVHGLTAGYAATILPIKSTTVSALETKFGREPLEQFIQEYDLAGRIEALTEKQGRFILNQPSLGALRDRITQERQEGGVEAAEGQVEASVRESEVTDPGTPPFARKPKATADPTNPDIRFARKPPSKLDNSMSAALAALRPRVAASEVLNEGKPVNSVGLPVIDLVDVVEPDGTLDISRAKIDSTVHVRRTAPI